MKERRRQHHRASVVITSILLVDAILDRTKIRGREADEDGEEEEEEDPTIYNPERKQKSGRE